MIRVRDTGSRPADRPPTPETRLPNPAALGRSGGRSGGRPTRSHLELGRESLQRPWYCASRHGRVGHRQTRQVQPKPRIPSPRSGSAPRPSGPAPAAGWSSPVARQAHNLKVTGSNPVPATTSPDTQKPRPARHRGSCRDRASSRNSNPIMRAPRARAPQGRRGGRHGSILESGSLRKARGGSPDVFGRGLQSPRRRKPHGRTLA